jgi:hypothetical protein
MIAATLRQTAAPQANAKSEIHMAAFPVSFALIVDRARSQRRTRLSVPGTSFSFGKITPFLTGKPAPRGRIATSAALANTGTNRSGSNVMAIVIPTFDLV